MPLITLTNQSHHRQQHTLCAYISRKVHIRLWCKLWWRVSEGFGVTVKQSYLRGENPTLGFGMNQMFVSCQAGVCLNMGSRMDKFYFFLHVNKLCTLASTSQGMLQKWVKHLAELAHPAGGIRPSRSPAELSALGTGRPQRTPSCSWSSRCYNKH